MKNYKLKKVKDAKQDYGYYYELKCKYGSANIFPEYEDENTTNYHAICHGAEDIGTWEIDSLSLGFVAEQAVEEMKEFLEDINERLKEEIKDYEIKIATLKYYINNCKKKIANINNLIKERDAE